MAGGAAATSCSRTPHVWRCYCCTCWHRQARCSPSSCNCTIMHGLMHDAYAACRCLQAYCCCCCCLSPAQWPASATVMCLSCIIWLIGTQPFLGCCSTHLKEDPTPQHHEAVPTDSVCYHCSPCCPPVWCPVDMIINQVDWPLLHQKHRYQHSQQHRAARHCADLQVTSAKHSRSELQRMPSCTVVPLTNSKSFNYYLRQLKHAGAIKNVVDAAEMLSNRSPG